MRASRRATPESAPHVFVLAGPNGAGKSTLAPYLLRDALGLTTFVNADEIARGLSAFAPETVAVRAGRIMLDRLHELTRERVNFAFETTLAGRKARDILHGCRSAGYHVHLLYLWLPSPDLAVARVQQRVLAGGHDIPEHDIRRRWQRSLVNLFDHYISLSSTWRLYDAGAPHPAPEIARGGEGRRTTVVSADRWQTVQGQAEHARRGESRDD